MRYYRTRQILVLAQHPCPAELNDCRRIGWSRSSVWCQRLVNPTHCAQNETEIASSERSGVFCPGTRRLLYIQNQAFPHTRNDTVKIHAPRLQSGLPRQAFLGVFKKLYPKFGVGQYSFGSLLGGHPFTRNFDRPAAQRLCAAWWKPIRLISVRKALKHWRPATPSRNTFNNTTPREPAVCFGIKASNRRVH